MKKDETTKKIVSGVIWSYAERFLAQFITLIVSIILARILSPEHYGVVAIVLVFISICDALVTGGFGNALVQKKDATKIDFDTICWLSIGIAVFLYLILFFFAPTIAEFYNDSQLIIITRIMGLKIVFSAYNSVQHAYLEKKLQFKKFFLATIIGTIISAIVGVYIAYNGGGVWAIVAQYMTNTVIDTFMLFVMIEWKPSLNFSIESLRKLGGFGIRMLVSTIVYTVKDNIRSLIIGKRFSAKDLAFYNQGKKYPQLIVNDIVSSFGKVLFPVLSNNQKDMNHLKSIIRKSNSLSSYLLSPFIIGLFSVADVFVICILTEKWLPCVLYLRILCFMYLTRSINTVLQKGILSVGRSDKVLIYEVITTISTVLLLLLSVFIFESIELIAYSYVLVEILGTIYYSICARKYFNYKYKEIIYDYFPPIIMSFIMGGIVILIGKISILPICKLLLQVTIGCIIYIGLSILSNNSNYTYIINYIKRKK